MMCGGLGRENTVNIFENGRKEAEKEVWEFMRACERNDTFENRWSIIFGPLKNYETYAEARRKFEDWKKSNVWIAKAGDIVRDRLNGWKGIVLDAEGDNLSILWDGGYGTEPIWYIEPTGEHIDITDILKALEV